MAKDRLNPCIHYVCKGETCKKGFKDVTLAKCKTCEKYRPRKSGQKQESVKEKRQEEKGRTAGSHRGCESVDPAFMDLPSAS